MSLLSPAKYVSRLEHSEGGHRTGKEITVAIFKTQIDINEYANSTPKTGPITIGNAESFFTSFGPLVELGRQDG
jgi:hypothetical protein